MKTSKSAVFLFELMIIILVFVLAAAVCTQIFASAFKMSVESRELTMSSINAQTVAEQFKAGVPDIDKLYFDADWEATSEAGAEYRVELDEVDGSVVMTCTASGTTAVVDTNMREAFVNVFKKGEVDAIYSLHVKEYIG